MPEAMSDEQRQEALEAFGRGAAHTRAGLVLHQLAREFYPNFGELIPGTMAQRYGHQQLIPGRGVVYDGTPGGQLMERADKLISDGMDTVNDAAVPLAGRETTMAAVRSVYPARHEGRELSEDWPYELPYSQMGSTLDFSWLINSLNLDSTAGEPLASAVRAQWSQEALAKPATQILAAAAVLEALAESVPDVAPIGKAISANVRVNLLRAEADEHTSRREAFDLEEEAFQIGKQRDNLVRDWHTGLVAGAVAAFPRAVTEVAQRPGVLAAIALGGVPMAAQAPGTARASDRTPQQAQQPGPPERTHDVAQDPSKRF